MLEEHMHSSDRRDERHRKPAQELGLRVQGLISFELQARP
jgi:hypothetical protein